MVTQAPRRSAVLVAIFFVLSCVGLILYVWGQFGGLLPLQPEGYRFQASFAQASQLTANADVRMAGVNVGKVVSVRPRGLLADATIELDPEFAPLSSDARAILRQKTLLGETFVALTRGSSDAPQIPENGRLNSRNVAETQQLDTVLGAFDPRTQRNLQRLLRGLSTSLDGRGSDVNSALGNADPALRSLDTVVEILDRQRGTLSRLVRDTGTVLQTVGDRRADLNTLVGSGNEVLSATAARDRQLTETIRALPPFLGQLRSTLRAVDTTAGFAGPSLRSLRPVAPLVRPALAELITLSPAIQGVMRDFGPLITTSIESLPAVTKIVEATVPFVGSLQETARQVTPGIDLTQRYGKVVTSAFANIAAAFQATAATGDGTTVHYLRTLIPAGSESVVGVGQRPGGNRHNPYPAPGILEGVGKGGIAASDCRNTANPGSGETPPCRVQPPFEFGGKSSYYPRLTPLPAQGSPGR